MPGSIFISYRRGQSAKDARALFERLNREFPGRVFIDLEGVQPGEDFVATLEGQLGDCAVLVALIGPDWLVASGALGQRRLDDPGDFVRLELLSAMRRAIPVLPVLVDGAAPPSEAQLPAELRALARRQAIPLDFTRFDADAGRLVATLRRLLALAGSAAAPAPSTAPRTRRRVAAWVLAALLGAGALYAAWRIATQPSPGDVAGPAAKPPAGPASTLAGPAPSRRPAPGALPWRFRDCDDGSCPWMVSLERGSFVMGSPTSEDQREPDEGPAHPVAIAQRFAVAETELTRGQFRAFVAATGHVVGSACRIQDGERPRIEPAASWLQPGFEQGDNHPVVCIDWSDAQAYAQWLARKTGKRYRLLSEAEWEYAARAGSTLRYSFSASADAICAHANLADRASKGHVSARPLAECNDGVVFTASVGSFRPNAWGLFDLQGNVWEWLQDCRRSNDYEGAPADGSSWEAPACERRVVRGGAWVDAPYRLRVANRGAQPATARASFLGTRVARSLP